MPFINNFWVQLLLIFILVLLISANKDNLQLKRNSLPNFSKSKDINLTSERKKWMGQIRSIGAKKAYEEIKKTYKLYPFESQHTGAHLFGELLYENEGISGLSICDGSFAFGCYHSFFAKAISEKGINIITSLDQACQAQYSDLGTGCQHGIGHGLMEYFGHDKLLQALSGCDRTKQISQLHGCTAGVFMEYNVPIVIAKDNIYSDIRKLDMNNPFAPCNTIVPEKYRNSCYAELAEWWTHVYNQDFKKIGQLCAKISTQKYQDSCILNLGNMAASTTNYDVAKTIDKCRQMPDDRLEGLCRIGAIWRYLGTDDYKERAYGLCQNIYEDLKDQCEKTLASSQKEKAN